MLEFLISIPLWIFVAALAEYSIHRWLMHQRSFCFLMGVHYRHAKLHHRRYYRTFNLEPDPYGREVNIELEWWFNLLLFLPVALTLIWCGYWISACAGACVAVIHALIWSLIHREMHMPSKKWFSEWRLFRWLRRYHCMHHRYPGYNFNVVLPSFDFIFRTHMKVSPKDDEEMSDIGV